MSEGTISPGGRRHTELDPFDPEFIAHPFPTYHQLQADGGAAYVDRGKGFWLITRHDLVRDVVGDVKQFVLATVLVVRFLRTGGPAIRPRCSPSTHLATPATAA